MKINEKVTFQTIVLLGFVILIQYFLKENFSFSINLTELITMACIYVAITWLNIYSALLIALIAPICDYILVAPRFYAELPISIPIIMLSNAVLVVIVWMFKDKVKFPGSICVGFALSVLGRFAVLKLVICQYIIPHFGGYYTVASEDLPLFIRDVKKLYSFRYPVITFIAGVIILSIYFIKVISSKRTNKNAIHKSKNSRK